MRLDLTRYRDITPHHRGAVIDAYSASTTAADGTPLPVCLKFFRRERMTIDDAFERRFLDVAARAAMDSSVRVARPFDFGLTPEGPAIVVPLVRGTSLRRIVERFAEHAEPVPTALVAHIARELLVILEEHAARRTAQELPHGENGHGSVSLSSIRFDERGHPLLTEPGMWSVFGEDAGAWRARVSRLRYRSEHPARAGTADVRDDVFALGACLEAMLTRSDGSPKAALLADFASRCASPSGYATVADVRAALDASFPASDHREAIVTWLASQASDVPKTASASGPKPRSPTSQPPSPASQPSAAPGVSQAPAASSVPLHRPRSVESDRSRVVIEQSGTTWPFFVFGIVVGFIATFGYALFRAAS